MSSLAARPRTVGRGDAGVRKHGGMAGPQARPWWQTAVVYQVYPRSFADASGDGVGDLRGVTERLDHLAWLGVDAVWLSPFYRSPMRDFGYDVADHTDVDPLFGSLTDFDALVRRAHELGLKVIVDYVPNHTSSDHPWFVASRSSREDPKRDWYVWADPAPGGGPPNNWLSVWGGSAWAWDEPSGQYYLHIFLEEMPDLNWRNPEVRAAMFDVARTWLDRGVDGFRIDVALYVMKDPELRDNPPADGDELQFHKSFGAWDEQLHVNDHAHPDAHAVWREFRALLDAAAPPERVSIAEIHVFDPVEWATWFGAALDEFHLPFNFSLLQTAWDARAIAETVHGFEAALPDGAWPNWVVGNHDEPRVASRIGPRATRLSMMLLLTLRGTPTLYYGDELGLPDVPVPPELMRDPQGRIDPSLSRDPQRSPMPWMDGPGAGFTEAGVEPWLPLAPGAGALSVERQAQDPDSLLSLTRALLAARRASSALTIGDWSEIEAPDGVLAYRRHSGDDARLVLLNLTSQRQVVPVEGRWEVEVSTAASGAAIDGRAPLRPEEGVVLRPAVSS
jgi:alpha-glucosidase